MQLAKFIYSAAKEHNTSLGNNKAFPQREDASFEYVMLKRRYKQIIEQIENVFGYLPTIEEAESLLNKLIVKTQKIEEPLRPQLEKLCEAVVNNVLSVPQETILLDCNIVAKVEPEQELRILPEFDEDEPTYDFSDVDEITIANNAILKRRMVNSLVQGVSYWLMMDNFDSSKISEWSNELSQLYLKIIALNDFLLYSKQEKITDKSPMLGAYVETHLGKGNQKTVITSQGLVYPLLLQETFRGFFELFASHGLPDDTKAAMYIIKHSDFIVAEAWDLRIGVPLWEQIEKISNNKIETSIYPYIFSSIAQLPIEDFNTTLQNIFCHTKLGKEFVNNIIEEVKHDEEYNLFKQDIEKFNLEKCVINDEDNDNDEEIIQESKKQLNTVVSDSNGNPIVCYHSTEKSFNTFDPARIGSGGAGCYHGYGFNFTCKPNSTYGKNVIEAYLVAKKPLWDKKKTINFNQLVKILVEIDKGEVDSIVCNFTGNNPKINGKGYWKEIHDTAKSILDYADGDLDIYANICTAACCGPQKVIDIFSKFGYDSAIETYDNGELRVVVVFYPEQVKIISKPLIRENKYADAWNNAYKALQDFQKEGEAKYGTPHWSAFGWMRINHPEIQIDPQDEAKYKELAQKEKEFGALWNEEDGKEEEKDNASNKWYEEQTNLINLAIERFGVTGRLSQAGYILPDGKLLNFGSDGERETDHRAIEGIYKNNNIAIWNDEYRYNYVVDFLNHGAIRIDANTGIIDMTQEPTQEQYRVIKQLVRNTGGEAYVDFTNNVGDTLHSAEYDHVTPSRLVADIYKYYNEGIKPFGDINESLKHKINESLQSWFQGSKVVNSDGSPKLMYRGDENQIDTFDRSQASSSNLYGTGFYFTDSKSHALQYGNAQSYYLRIIHPLATDGHEITKQQLFKFLVAVDKNEDYGLYNYGYGATPQSVLKSVWGKSDFAMMLDINACCIGDLVEATLLFNDINGTDFDGFILDTETVVFDDSQIKKVNNKISESKQYINEGKVDKQAEKRCYDVIKQGNSWLQPVMDNPCTESDAISGMTNFQYEYKGIRDHWVRNNVKFTPVVMNILYNQLGYRGTNPQSDKIDTFSKILNLINSDKRFNSLPWTEAIKYSYNDWYKIFAKTLENEEAMENATINGTEYSNSNYQVIKIESFKQAKEIGDKSGSKEDTKLCYTQGESTWNSYTNNGENTAYVCLKNGWESIPATPGNDAPMDEYGLSMIFVFVDPRGKLTTSNTRWNHGYVSDYNAKHHTNRTVDKFLTRAEISQIVQVNFMETFKGKNSRSLEENMALMLQCENTFDLRDCCDDYQLVSDTKDIIVELNNKYNLLDFKNKRFLLENWVDSIVVRRYGYVLIQDGGNLSVFDCTLNKYTLKNTQLNISDALGDMFFEVKIDEHHVGIYDSEKGQFINDEKYTDINPWNDFFQVFNGEKSSFVNQEGQYLINGWFDNVFEPNYGADDKYVVCKAQGKWNVLVYDKKSIRILSEDWFDDIDYKRNFFAYPSSAKSSEHGYYYTKVEVNGTVKALFKDGYVASMWQSCVCGVDKYMYYDELGNDIFKWLYDEKNGDKYGCWQQMYEWYKNEGSGENLASVATDYAQDRLTSKYNYELSDEEMTESFKEYQKLLDDAFIALQKLTLYYFNYNSPEEDVNESKTYLKEYLDKEYMKPLYDYLKNGDKYSSEGHYSASERLIIPFFEWCTDLDDNEWRNFKKALNNCQQLQEKVRAVNGNDGKHIIRCFSMRSGQLQYVPTREFLKQNARRLFTITYNDSELSQYWDKFYFFINKEEGRQQLKRGQYLDADTVLMNPEIKKPMWLVHFTGNKEDALDIVQNGFKHGLLPNQMSKLGYTNKDIQKIDKQGKYMYAYNAEEITQGFFPADFTIPKEQWRYNNNFDQKVWENAIHYAVMFVSSGIEARHDTDNQQQVIFNADMARNFVLLSFIWNKDKAHEWGVQTKDGRIIYKNQSLTNTIKWVMSNYNQYRGKICWKR